MKIKTRDPSVYQSWTPATAGLGVLSNLSIFWRRNGTTISGYGRFTTGTVSAVTATFGLPTGLTFGGASGLRMQAGFVNRNSGSAVQMMAIENQTAFKFGGGASSHGDVNGDSLFGSSETVYFRFEGVPIKEFGG